MKEKFIFCFMLAFAAGSSGAEAISALSPHSRESVDLYDLPSANLPSKTIQADTIRFPLPILSNQSGYLKTSIGAKEYWIKSSQVRIRRDVSDSCGSLTSMSRTATSLGSTPKTHEDSCR